MNKEIIKEEIKNLMEVIQEQQGLVLAHQGKIPQIEFDILMANFRKAYELFGELNKMESIPAPAPVPQNSVDSSQSDELIAEVTIPVVEEKPIPVAEVKNIESVPEIITEEPVIENIIEEINLTVTPEPVHTQPEEIIVNVETKVEVVEIEPVSQEVIIPAAINRERTREFTKPSTKVAATASLFDEPSTIAGQFQGSTTVRDKIASNNEDKSVAEKLQQHPVSDLKKSIGINEKFAFINELFDGDLEEYNNAIDQLNNCKSYSDAKEFLSNQLAAKHNWSNKGESFIQLNNLLERRFSS